MVVGAVVPGACFSSMMHRRKRHARIVGDRSAANPQTTPIFMPREKYAAFVSITAGASEFKHTMRQGKQHESFHQNSSSRSLLFTSERVSVLWTTNYTMMTTEQHIHPTSQ